MINVERYLEDHHIRYTLYEHPAVYTCEEAEEYCSDIPGLACKNLFLKSKKNKRYFLVILPATKRVDLAHIADLVGETKVSFADARIMKEKLGLDPGSVSPFGLLNNAEQDVELYIERDVYDADIVTFHPNRNTATLEMTQDMFHQFLQTLGNKIVLF
jgi:Ala-tRNA(Pro) deacylase